MRAHPAHPRACGENSILALVSLIERGSSPRVRGKPRVRVPVRSGRRLIPARAGKTYDAVAEHPELSAHPRACGENGVHFCSLVALAGSSPRVRGKHATVSTLVNRRGLIPARAGKTATRRARTCDPTAHPRACGENSDQAGAHLRPYGSSPRVRGKRYSSRLSTSHGGLIPARAGKTLPSKRGRIEATAHPRACGENLPATSSMGVPMGSSPRVRGKLVGEDEYVGGGRLIPARAGKTTCRAQLSSMVQAHPRACGENSAVSRVDTLNNGSSPRVRGKPRRQRATTRDSGLIPARAGKTRQAWARASWARAHPRACGENAPTTSTPGWSPGSSPRVRGKRDARRPDGRAAGLIPARAGKTTRCQRRARTGWAHPRACGENIDCAYYPHGETGSSPRVRGKRDEVTEVPGVPGLIPARAGKTNSV